MNPNSSASRVLSVFFCMVVLAFACIIDAMADETTVRREGHLRHPVLTKSVVVVETCQTPAPVVSATVNTNSITLMAAFSPGGLSGTGVSKTLYTPKGFGGLLTVDAVAFASLGKTTDAYMGGVLAANIAINRKYGYYAKIGLGWTGPNLTGGFQLPHGWNNALIEAALTIPYR